eukprot:gnl/TRDRNA2_/TRDRNA2_30921_c0_seq1.p1 gnl/TRDRNA2_/TRDRNA2_30921_c0~~gnl/TRDRNA2_/TRDRNA2_30921_c0_seq1.p1  ORF type:complete len:157 (+),score=26.98 gnl/TRDRNA2_/TRDRNA2_30921_c0_seq1:30-473(+)
MWRPGYSPKSALFRYPYVALCSFPAMLLPVPSDWHSILVVTWGVGSGCYCLGSGALREDLCNKAGGALAAMPAKERTVAVAKFTRGVGVLFIAMAIGLTAAEAAVRSNPNARRRALEPEFGTYEAAAAAAAKAAADRRRAPPTASAS